MPARAAQVQGAEQCADDDRFRVLVSSWSATVRTRHLLGQAGAYLLVDQNGLHLLEKVLRFLQVKAERVDRKRLAVDVSHLVHGWRVLVIFVV
jgi:hypothetical protein